MALLDTIHSPADLRRLGLEELATLSAEIRELLVQVDHRNLDCEVILPGATSARLEELLPRAWLEPLLARR